MASKPLPDAALLRQLLRYDPHTGLLFWLPRSPEHFPADRKAESSAMQFNNYFAGKEAFTSTNENGYRQGWFMGRKYLAHRLIWKMVTGIEPETLDHINGQPCDNRWSNLRSIPRGENNWNCQIYANNTSGVTGVYWRTKRGKWVAEIKVSRRRHYLGSFDSLDDARSARLTAEREHGFHPNHGRKAN